MVFGTIKIGVKHVVFPLAMITTYLIVALFCSYLMGVSLYGEHLGFFWHKNI